MSILFAISHAIGVLFFFFGLLMLVIYMAKYLKKEMLYKVAVGFMIFGFVLSALGILVAPQFMTDEDWNMMDDYDRSGMMNWNNDSDDATETTTDSPVAN